MEEHKTCEVSPNTNVIAAKSEKKKAEEVEDYWLYKYFQLIRRFKITLTEAIIFSPLIALLLPLGAQSTGWNASLSEGIWTSFVGLAITGVGYICLCLCMAEMSSALPFSGGVFGCVRATAGPFVGYLVACFELLTNIAYISSQFALVTSLPADAGHFDDAGHILVMAAMYVIAVVLCLVGNTPFWIFTCLLGLICFSLLIIYIFGSIGTADYDHYAAMSSNSITFVGVMSCLQLSSTQYMGVQYVPLLSRKFPDAKKDLPVVILTTVSVSILCALLLCLLTACNSPGSNSGDELSEALYPLNFGFKRIFNIDEVAATWLSFPGLFGALFAFVFCCARQFHTISRMGLLPSIFHEKLPVLETPYFSLFFLLIVTLALNIVVYFEPVFAAQLTSIAMLSSYVVGMITCASYFIFTYSFDSLQRSFKSPGGIVTAALGFVIFLFCAISSVFYQQPGDYIPIVVFVSYFIVAVVFYIFYMGSHQKFSDEEKKHMFHAYLVNANRAKRQRMNKNNKVQPQLSNQQNQGKRSNNFTSTEQNSSTVHEGENDLEKASDIRQASSLPEQQTLQPHSSKTSKKSALSAFQERAILDAGGIIDHL